MASTNFAGEEVLDVADEDGQSMLAGDGQTWGCVPLNGKSEDSEGVHKHPQCTWVATEVWLGAITRLPLGLFGK